ncbi:MAG: PorT family protein [Bacteroidales bacterium]|nr:PorT family protein [Bacteroidales bacterium]
MERIILSICLLAFTFAGFAQTYDKGLSFSMKTGVSFANMYGPEADAETFLNGRNPENFYANHPASTVFKSGFNFGVLLDKRTGKHFSYGFGASYIQKGARVNATKHWNSDLDDYESVDGRIVWKQNFLSVELPFTYYLPIQQDELYFRLGLFAGILLKSEEKGDINIAGMDYKYVNKRDANKVEPGYFVVAGYMYALPNSKSKLFAEISWARSVFVSPGRDMIPNSQFYYNQSISINIGYQLMLGTK